MLFIEGRTEAEHQRAHDRSPAIRQARRRLAAMQDREGVVVPCSFVGSRNCYPEARAISWMHDRSDGGVPLMLVNSRDIVQPYHRHQNGSPVAALRNESRAHRLQSPQSVGCGTAETNRKTPMSLLASQDAFRRSSRGAYRCWHHGGGVVSDNEAAVQRRLKA